MSYTDWTYLSQFSGPPGIIDFIGDVTVPIVPLNSLNIRQQGLSTAATGVVYLRPPFPVHYDSGRLRSLFLKRPGVGFRDSGFFFLATSPNPLLDDVQGYAAYFIDGGTVLRLVKFTNGLHDFTSQTILMSQTVPYTGGTEHVAFEVEWEGGIRAQYTGFTKITLRFASNTTAFTGMTAYVHNDASSPILVGGSEGLFFRSRNASELINARIDQTSLFIRHFG